MRAMEMSEVNVPKLRFREFEGEWVEKRLGDIAKITMGQSPSSSSYNDKNIGIPLIQGNADCKNRKTLPRIFTTESTKECNVNDIIMTVRAPVGAVSKSYHNACIGRGVCAITSKEKNDFIYQFLIKYEDKWNKYAQGSTFTAVNSKDIANLKLNLPQKPEQQKIANFLTSIDQKIEQLTKKEKLLVAYKKGVMQKIFSQEIRFRDENGEVYGDWVERKLGDVGIYISDGNYGEMYPKSNEMKLSGIPFIRANNIKNLTLSWRDMKYIDEKLHNILTSGHLQTNDILVTTRGDIGMLAYVKQEFNNANINAQICLLRCNENLNSFYLLQYLASKEGTKQFKKFQTGSALKQLPKSSLKKIKFPYPCLPEQTKIANFLSSIDKKIEQVNRQIEESKGFKKGLLQEMFV